MKCSKKYDILSCPLHKGSRILRRKERKPLNIPQIKVFPPIDVSNVERSCVAVTLQYSTVLYSTVLVCISCQPHGDDRQFSFHPFCPLGRRHKTKTKLAMPSNRLWLEPGEKVAPLIYLSAARETYDQLFQRCSVLPEKKSVLFFISQSVVVGQECILTCLFLAVHRDASQYFAEYDIDALALRLQPSLVLVWFALFLVILNNRPSSADASLSRKTKVKHRTTDGIFMAVFLRFFAVVLKTLTASYSSDTVHALAIASFAMHLLACDYDYANGFGEESETMIDRTKRPPFRGGTLSLTAAFFGTTLLASRLQSNLVVFVFISSSVVLFALYPAARYQVAINTSTRYRWGK